MVWLEGFVRIEYDFYVRGLEEKKLLTDKGIEYLREYLHLPADIIPATHKKPLAAARPAGFRSNEADGEGAGKDNGPSGDFKPSYRGREEGYRREGGFGRGRQM